MKKLIIVAIALFTLNASAALEPVKPNEALRADIVQLIGDKYPVQFNKEECNIEVLFTVNSKSEIIVLSSNAPSEIAERFIRNKLNYKKVNYKSTKVGELFLLPLTFKKS